MTIFVKCFSEEAVQNGIIQWNSIMKGTMISSENLNKMGLPISEWLFNIPHMKDIWEPNKSFLFFVIELTSPPFIRLK